MEKQSHLHKNYLTKMENNKNYNIQIMKQNHYVTIVLR